MAKLSTVVGRSDVTGSCIVFQRLSILLILAVFFAQTARADHGIAFSLMTAHAVLGATPTTPSKTEESKAENIKTPSIPLSIGAYQSHGMGDRSPYFLYSEVKGNLEDLKLDEKGKMVEFFNAVKNQAATQGNVAFKNDIHPLLKTAYDEKAILRKSDVNMTTKDLMAHFAKWLKIEKPFLRVGMYINNQRSNGQATTYKLNVSVCGEKKDNVHYAGEISCSGTNLVDLTPELLAKSSQPDFLHNLLVDHMKTLGEANDAFVWRPALERLQQWKVDTINADAEELTKDFRGSARAY